MSPILVALAGCTTILAFDAIGSLLARRFGFAYALLAPGSLALYAATGFFAARAQDGFLVGAAAGAAVAATESTLGWRISRAVGVDREDAVTSRGEMAVAGAVTLSGAILGGAAGLFA